MALESVAEGAAMATNAATAQLREADGRIQEAGAAEEPSAVGVTRKSQRFWGVTRSGESMQRVKKS